MILAGVCIAVAAYFMWRRNLDAAFVVAALGLVAWFLNYRAQMKGVIAAANLQDSVSEKTEESDDDSDDE
jgi:hypothetical protein